MIKDLWPFIVIQLAIIVMTGLLISGTDLLRSSVVEYDHYGTSVADISGLNNDFIAGISPEIKIDHGINFKNYYQSFDLDLFDLLYRKRYRYALDVLKTNYALLDDNDVRCNSLLYYMGYICFEMKKYLRAKDYWLTLLLREQKNIHVLNSLGVVCMELKEYTQAKNYFERAFDIDSTNVLIIKNLLVVYKKLKMSDEAFFLDYRLKEIQNID